MEYRVDYHTMSFRVNCISDGKFAIAMNVKNALFYPQQAECCSSRSLAVGFSRQPNTSQDLPSHTSEAAIRRGSQLGWIAIR